MCDVKGTVHQGDNDTSSVSSSDSELDDGFPVDVEEHRDIFYEGPNRRRYYLLNEVVKIEEDQTTEFKGHQNICTEQVPPWCYDKYDNSNRTRSAITRNLCGFLNTGLGGTTYIGIVNDGTVVGVRLTVYQQDHLLVSLYDALDRFRPPVPRHLYDVRFVPVIDSMKNLPQERLPISEAARDEPHILRTHVYCWCDLESLSRYFHGLTPTNWVVEITILPINPEDEWVRELAPESKVVTLPVFQADNAQIYVRKHTTLTKYSIRDVVEQAREEVQLKKMKELMEAWKQCRVAEKLYYAFYNALKKLKEETGSKKSNDLTDIGEKIKDLNIVSIDKVICEENVTTKDEN